MEDFLIAIVDDVPEIVEDVSYWLKKEGFTVKGFPSGKELFRFLRKTKPDLIILDLMLPNMTGFEICRKLKEKERFAAIPIIILSGRSGESDKISGLGLGADDYVVKPFSLDELVARIRAVLRRRSPAEKEKTITVGGRVKLDQRKYQVTVDGEDVNLTSTEFRILELLASRKGQVFTRDRILDYLWGEDKIVIERTVDVHIRHLRKKLGEAGDLIKNLRGVGYKIEEEQ